MASTNISLASLYKVAGILCDYLIAEEDQINIKASTKEGKIKSLEWLADYLNNKPFREITKNDILQYLNSLKRPALDDPTHKSVGTYNARMIFLKFFRWLYNPDEPDHKKRVHLSVCPELGDYHDKKSHHISLVTYGHMTSMIFS